MVPRKTLESYVIGLHQRYKQKTVKRKIASLKAFYNYLEMEEKIEANPLRRIRMDFREEKVLPRTIPAVQVERLLKFMYSLQNDKDLTPWQRKNVERDLAVVELLFATGLRISELCHLIPDRVDLEQGILCIRGKGSKERYIQIANTAVLRQVKKYRAHWSKEIQAEQFFFLNRYGKRYSEQSARKMIKKYARQAGICLNITPPHVPAHLCHPASGRGCGHPLYPENAGAFFHPDDPDLYGGCQPEADGDTENQASQEPDEGELVTIIDDYREGRWRI